MTTITESPPAPTRLERATRAAKILRQISKDEDKRLNATLMSPDPRSIDEASAAVFSSSFHAALADLADVVEDLVREHGG